MKVRSLVHCPCFMFTAITVATPECNDVQFMTARSSSNPAALPNQPRMAFQCIVSILKDSLRQSHNCVCWDWPTCAILGRQVKSCCFPLCTGRAVKLISLDSGSNKNWLACLESFTNTDEGGKAENNAFKSRTCVNEIKLVIIKQASQVCMLSGQVGWCSFAVGTPDLHFVPAF